MHRHRQFNQGGRSGWGRGPDDFAPIGHRHHGRGFGGPDFPGRGRGRRRKFVDGDQLRLLILDLLAGEPRHGYDLIRAFEEQTGGAYAPSPGVIYPQLAMLADEGLIAEAESDGARKSYKLTPEGDLVRKKNAAEIAALTERFSAFAERRRHSDSEPARRAMHNLKDALMARLSRDDTDEDVLFKAVEIIDSAAQKIERL